MPSETDCANDALAQIGIGAIGGLDDGTINAKKCLLFYGPLRDALLRAHHWNFAMQRVQLAQNAIAPIDEFAFAYTLPADCLKVVDYAGGNPNLSTIPQWPATTPATYKIEGRNLFSNDGQAFIRYLRRVTNVGEFDPLFYQLLAKLLASKLALAIAKDFKMATALKQEAMALDFPMATAVDGQEGSVEPFTVDDLLWGRTYG